jgi:hypothetical protein
MNLSHAGWAETAAISLLLGSSDKGGTDDFGSGQDCSGSVRLTSRNGPASPIQIA